MTSYMLSGGCAGIMYWSAFYPADVVKSRLQTAAANAAEGAPSSFPTMFKHIFRTEGIRGLYRGLGLTAARAFPSHAFLFYAYEVVFQKLDELF